MISFSVVNWLGVILGTVLSMVLGFLWYGPLFGKTWLALIGKTEEEIEADPTVYIKTAVAAFLAMLVLNMVVAAFGATTFFAGFFALGLSF